MQSRKTAQRRADRRTIRRATVGTLAVVETIAVLAVIGIAAWFAFGSYRARLEARDAIDRAAAERHLAAIRSAEDGRKRAAALASRIAESHLDAAAQQQAAIDLDQLRRSSVQLIQDLRRQRTALMTQANPVIADPSTPVCQTLDGLAGCLERAHSETEREQIIVACNITAITAELEDDAGLRAMHPVVTSPAAADP